MGSRVSVIGLDGATFRLISPWAEAGELPTIRSLMDTGAWGNLESTIHPLSPQAWASFMTGKNPGKHGIFEFVEHEPNSYDLRYVNGGAVRGKSLWRILTDAGKRVCVVNVPFTYPPDNVNGCLIAGLDSPGIHSVFCHPPQLMEDITKRFGEYQLRRQPYGATPESYLDDILAQFDYILRVADYLKGQEDWDLFVVVFESSDLVQHFYWHYAFPETFGLAPAQNPKLADAILDVYRRLDAGIRMLTSTRGSDETVIVMSDHGFAPCRKIFFMDKWLHHQGYLAYRAETDRAHDWTRWLHGVFQRHVPGRCKEWLTTRVPGLRDRLRSYLTTAKIEWNQTRAFSLGIDSTNIFINSTDRFPTGVVRQGYEYERVRDEIAGKLAELVDPDTGEKIVRRVYRREELYHGDCLSKAPDLLVTWKDFEYNTRRGYEEEGDGFMGSALAISDVSRYSSLEKSGTHHVDGIFIVNGPDIHHREGFEGARIIDLAPTILYLLGEKIPEDFDGRVVSGVFKGDAMSRPIELIASQDVEQSGEGTDYDKDEAQYIAAKLRGLGYID